MFIHYLRFSILALAMATAFAQPVPKITSLSSEWIQRGKEARITITGENLATVTNVFLSGAPGVNAWIPPVSPVALQIESPIGGISSVSGQDGKSAQVILKVEPDAVLSDRELRLVSSEGVSNPLVLHVGPLPEVVSTSNTSRMSSQKIELPVAISGVISAPAQSDYFRFRGEKGHHVVVDLYAYRMGSKLDSSLSISDVAGKELARSEDAVGLDSVIDFAVPEDGEYLIELRDFRYQGGGEFKYRMIVGVMPHVRRIFPFGGQRGQTVDLNLDGTNLESPKLILKLTPESPIGKQEIRVSSGRGLSNPFMFEVSDLVQIKESEPNSALDQADRVSIPVAINGRIGQKKDYDAFRFRAGAGQRIVFEVAASQFGSPLDSLLILTDATGAVLQRNDDSSGEDAKIDFTFKTGGDHFIILEDLLGRGGEEFTYQLTAESPQPDFSVVMVRDTPRLRRGGRVPIRCEVSRSNGFNDSVTIFCSDLPPGVQADPIVVSSSNGSAYLILNAASDAPLGSFPLTVLARASYKGKSLIHEVKPLANDKTAKQAFVTILDEAPFSITSPTLASHIEQNQSEELEVSLERRSGFDGEVKIFAEGFSAGRDPISKSFDVQPLIIRPGETKGTLSLKAKTESEVGTRPIVLRAESESGVVAYSPLIPVSTAQLPFVLTTSLKKLVVTALPASTGSAAGEALFNAKVDRRAGFEGEVELKLEGIPEGVVANVTNIPAKMNEIALRLIATEKAPAGTNLQLTLKGVGQHKDRIYRMQAPTISLSINAPETEEAKEPKLANKK